MLDNASPTLKVGSPAFVAAHRLIGDVGAGRPVLLYDGKDSALVAPLDGGPLLSRRLAIAAPRASYLRLGNAARTVEAPGANRERLWEIASARTVSLGEASITPCGPIAEAACELAKLAQRLPAVTIADADAAPAGTLGACARDVLALRRTLAATVRPVASATVPLAAGGGTRSEVTAFRDAIGGTISAVSVGELRPGSLVRVHSSCVTGDIFGSLKCDCGAQLNLALEAIAAEGGVLIYAAQEGRGIGLVNKLRAYALQDEGLDTVDANLALGHHDDERDYAAAAAVLSALGLTEVRLLTNNPAKIAGLAAFGLAVTAVPLVGPVTPQNAGYIATKARRSGHRL